MRLEKQMPFLKVGYIYIYVEELCFWDWKDNIYKGRQGKFGLKIPAQENKGRQKAVSVMVFSFSSTSRRTPRAPFMIYLFAPFFYVKSLFKHTKLQLPRASNGFLEVP